MRCKSAAWVYPLIFRILRSRYFSHSGSCVLRNKELIRHHPSPRKKGREVSTLRESILWWLLYHIWANNCLYVSKTQRHHPGFKLEAWEVDPGKAATSSLWFQLRQSWFLLMCILRFDHSQSCEHRKINPAEAWTLSGRRDRKLLVKRHL